MRASTRPSARRALALPALARGGGGGSVAGARAGSMAAARCLRLCGRWRPALLGPARRRLLAAASSAAPPVPLGSAAPASAAFSVGPRWHQRSPGGLAGGDALEGGGGGGEDGSGGGGADAGGAGPVMTALTPLLVPEHFPNVPLIAVTRNPVFPRFIKIIEVRGRRARPGPVPGPGVRSRRPGRLGWKERADRRQGCRGRGAGDGSGAVLQRVAERGFAWPWLRALEGGRLPSGRGFLLGGVTVLDHTHRCRRYSLPDSCSARAACLLKAALFTS